ncbi:hypothetical protein [Methylibium sp.]|uniref:hypothetical protein n=1 Tax=Methylibium sp. TaxID=2067992 RepID=UPI003D10BD2E
MILDPAELLDLVDEGLAALPAACAPPAKWKLRQLANAATQQVSSSSPATRDLAAAMQPFGFLILDRSIDAAAKRVVVSVPLPLCNAVAKVRQGLDCIFLFDGLFDVAVANIAMSHALQGLPSLFDTNFPKPDYPDVSARAWVSVLFGALINRFVTHAEPLPDFRLLIAPPGVDVELHHTLMGAAWWTLLHELGHFELGHLQAESTATRPSISGELVLDEHLSTYQLEEFAADDFAFQSLTDTGQALAYGWATYALAPSMMLETLAASEGAPTHPLSVNRLERARSLSSARDAIQSEIGAEEHLRRHGGAHVNIRREHANIRSMDDQPMFDGWPAEALHAALGGMSGLFEASGLDLEVFRESTFSWRNLAGLGVARAEGDPNSISQGGKE